MHILTILIIYGGISFFTKRSEETFRHQPKRTFTHKTKPYNCNFLNVSVYTILVSIIPLQTLIKLLIIGGVELNPGPENNTCCKSCLFPASAHLIECSTCTRDFSINDIDLPLFTYHYIYRTKGTFIFICENCSNSYEEEKIVKKYSDITRTPLTEARTKTIDTKRSQLERLRSIANSVSPSSSVKERTNSPIYPHDSRSSITVLPNLHHRINLKSKLLNSFKSKSSNTNSNTFSPNKFKDKSNKEIKQYAVQPLLSLTLRPPKSHILLKWCNYFRHSTEIKTMLTQSTNMEVSTYTNLKLNKAYDDPFNFIRNHIQNPYISCLNNVIKNSSGKPLNHEATPFYPPHQFTFTQASRQIL